MRMFKSLSTVFFHFSSVLIFPFLFVYRSCNFFLEVNLNFSCSLCLVNQVQEEFGKLIQEVEKPQ